MQDKKKLFTSYDGVDIYEGDLFHYADVAHWHEIEDGRGLNEKDYRIPFASLEAAKEHVRLNEPLYSINDLGEIISEIDKLKKLLKLV